MSSASNGRKNRPRSAGNIFQIGKPPYRDPQRRESTESTRKAQRAVADCRMVGLRHVNACMVLLIRSAVLLSFFVLGQSTIPCMQDAQATAVNSCRKEKKKHRNPVWQPKNSYMHLHCFVASKAKQIISACRLTVWFAFGVWKAARDLWLIWKSSWITRLSVEVFVIVALLWSCVLTDPGRNDHKHSLLHPFIHQWTSWSLAVRIQDAMHAGVNEMFVLQSQALRLCKQPNFA